MIVFRFIKNRKALLVKKMEEEEERLQNEKIQEEWDRLEREKQPILEITPTTE